jgi:hypothetical protein
MELAVGAVKICDGEARRDDKKLQTKSLSLIIDHCDTTIHIASR